MRGVARTVVGAIGDELTRKSLGALATQFPNVVESVMPIQKRFKLVSRLAHPANSTVKIREGVVLGRKKFHVMAGPCSVEGEKQLLKTAEAVKAAGATVFRGRAAITIGGGNVQDEKPMAACRSKYASVIQPN